MADGDGPQRELLDGLKKIQDSIGVWHDWVELHAIAADLLQHNGCKLVAEFEQREKDKLREALRVTEHVRKRYLRPTPISVKARSRKSAATLSSPVIAATARIVA